MPTLRTAIPALVSQAVEAEHAHALRAIEALVDRTAESLDQQIRDRKDTLDAFFESQRDSPEPLKPPKAAEELGALMQTPLRLTGDQARLLTEDPSGFKKWLLGLVEGQIVALNVARIVGAIERRLGESLELKIQASDWDSAAKNLLTAAGELFERQRQRLLAQVERDLDALLQREANTDETARLRVLLSLSQGVRTLFDQRTHRQVKQVFSRFSYVYLAAALLEGQTADAVTDSALDHLESAESSSRPPGASASSSASARTPRAWRISVPRPTSLVTNASRIRPPASATPIASC